MEYKVDCASFFISEIIFNNKYGFYWNVDNDIYSNVNDFKILKKHCYVTLMNGNKLFNCTDILNYNNKIKYIRLSANEYIYGTNSKHLNKELLMIKFKLSNNIDDLINHSFIRYHSPLKHENKIFKNGFNNYQGIVQFNDTILRYQIRIGITKNNESIFYDLSVSYLDKKRN